MVRSAPSRVSNHDLLQALILRDAAKTAPQDEENIHTAAGFGAGLEIASAISAATMHSAPAMKNAGR
jgi:hypothetical protein